MKVIKQNNSHKGFLFISLLSFFAFTSCSSDGTQFKQGQKLYAVHCESCHMVDGSGLGANIPPLATSDYLKERQEKIACIIRYGMTDTITVNGVEFSEQMAPIPQLTEFQMANIINYINHAWGNNFGFVTVETLRTHLENCD